MRSGTRGLSRTALITSALAISIAASACSASSQGDEVLETNNALGYSECQGTADTGFCGRNADQGDAQVSSCWAEAEAPWEAYLRELRASRDTRLHPEIAACAAAESAKGEPELRKECSVRTKSAVCDAVPESLLRLWAELRCTTQSPAYKDLNAQWVTREAAYLRAGARCVGMWMKNKIWHAGCLLVEKAVAEHTGRGTASPECLMKCPAPGPGGSCVPARYRMNNDPVPCGVIKEVDGLCDCSEDTAVCGRYRDAIENPDGLAICPPGRIATPYVFAEPGKAAKMVVECERPRSRE